MNIEAVNNIPNGLGSAQADSDQAVEQALGDEEISKSQQRATLKQVSLYLERLDLDQPHCQHVTKLALRLFDGLSAVHGLGTIDRFRLQCASLLHDIGWVGGAQAHHKRSMQMILDANELGFTDRSRILIANIARYHRRALPKHKHRRFSSLDKTDQYNVSILAALLRIADGLDCTHLQLITSIRCHVTNDRIDIDVLSDKRATLELLEAREKGEWLGSLIERNIYLKSIRIKRSLKPSK